MSFLFSSGLRSTIPDSTVFQHTAKTFSTGDATWSDDIGSNDMEMSGDPQATTMSDGAPSVAGDGTDDYGTVTLPQEFEGNSLNSFSIEFSIETTESEEVDLWGVVGPTPQRLIVTLNIDPSGSNDGSFEFVLDDLDNNRFRFGPSSANLNDGNRHDVTVIVNDAANNDADIIIDGANKSLVTGATQSPDNFGTWDQSCAFWASNRSGSISNYSEGDIGINRWHDTNISEQTISDY